MVKQLCERKQPACRRVVIVDRCLSPLYEPLISARWPVSHRYPALGRAAQRGCNHTQQSLGEQDVNVSLSSSQQPPVREFGPSVDKHRRANAARLANQLPP